MKRIFCIGLVLLLIVAAGCTPTPAPSNTASPLPDLTPDMTPAASPDDTGGTGTGGNGGGTAGVTIPDFAEGTVVEESDLPDIKSALQTQYPGATISRITHGLQGTQQAYAVEYTMADGTTGTAYILPDGTILPDAAAASPGAAASPAASPDAGTSTEGTETSPGATTTP